MDISAGLIAKGTAGALAASAAVGGGVMAGTDWFDGLWPNNAVEDESVSGVKTPERSDLQPESHVPRTASEGKRVQEETGSTDGSDRSSIGSTNENENTPQGTAIGGEPARDGIAETTETHRGEGSRQVNDRAAETQNQSQGSAGESGVKKQQTKLTKWDKALIDYLNNPESNDRDIIFDVKTGNKTKVDLTNVFPSFDDDGQKKIIIAASITTSNANLKGGDNSDKITELKNMNGGKDWSWECKIILSKEKKGSGSINLENKEKLIGDDGYFNKLVNVGEKNLKTKFIENCAEVRGRKSEALNEEKIITEKTFKFKSDGTGLEDNDDRDFRAWFLTAAAQ